jgi:hypothetical protein
MDFPFRFWHKHIHGHFRNKDFQPHEKSQPLETYVNSFQGRHSATAHNQQLQTYSHDKKTKSQTKSHSRHTTVSWKQTYRHLRHTSLSYIQTNHEYRYSTISRMSTALHSYRIKMTVSRDITSYFWASDINNRSFLYDFLWFSSYFVSQF